MMGTPKLVRFSPLLLVLLVFALCQVYILITHEVVTSYVRSKLSELYSSFRSSDYLSRSRSQTLSVLLLSYSRTGSSFFGDFLHSYPCAFYHYEPLNFFSNNVLNSSFSEAREFLHKMFRCQVSHVPGYLNWHKGHRNSILLRRNARHWKTCSALGTCYDATFMDNYCSNHSMVLIKTIRLDLRAASRLFEEFPDLNLKIIYLARDPRGTMNSRMKEPVTEWCRNDPQCYDPGTFCKGLQDDAEVACDLHSSRPQDFAIVRYEDLTSRPLEVLKRLVRFLGLRRTKEMEEFLRSHTSSPSKTEHGLHIAYSTFRNSANTSTKWRHQLPFEKIIKIQKECSHVLEWLGYHTFTSEESLKSADNFDTNMHSSVQQYCDIGLRRPQC